ncbi:MAG: hypothetical protein F6K47_37280 [Symploca sp. SIO2E6]|nr:hypothetical protein [Symploca sp. SIO2E6]
MSIGESLWLIGQTKSYCQAVKIKSIRITIDGKEENVNEIDITDEVEIGIKFDKNARKELRIYKDIE